MHDPKQPQVAPFDIDDGDLDAVAGGASAAAARPATIETRAGDSSLGDVDLDARFITYIDPYKPSDGAKLKR